MSEPTVLTPTEKIELGTQRVIADLEAQLHATDVARLELLAEVERLQRAEAFAIRMWERTQKDAAQLLGERGPQRCQPATQSWREYGGTP